MINWILSACTRKLSFLGSVNQLFMRFQASNLSYITCRLLGYMMVRHTYSQSEVGRNRDHWKRHEKSRGNRKSNSGGVWHEHKCKWCSKCYAHLHPMKYHDHPQFKYQCPNKFCEAYHRGRNETRAYLIENKNDK